MHPNSPSGTRTFFFAPHARDNENFIRLVRGTFPVKKKKINRKETGLPFRRLCWVTISKYKFQGEYISLVFMQIKGKTVRSRVIIRDLVVDLRAFEPISFERCGVVPQRHSIRSGTNPHRFYLCTPCF